MVCLLVRVVVFDRLNDADCKIDKCADWKQITPDQHRKIYHEFLAFLVLVQML